MTCATSWSFLSDFSPLWLFLRSLLFAEDDAASIVLALHGTQKPSRHMSHIMNLFPRFVLSPRTSCLRNLSLPSVPNMVVAKDAHALTTRSLKLDGRAAAAHSLNWECYQLQNLKPVPTRSRQWCRALAEDGRHIKPSILSDSPPLGLLLTSTNAYRNGECSVNDASISTSIPGSLSY